MRRRRRASAAEGLNYNYVEAGWTRISVDSGDDDIHSTGGYIRGSWQIANPTYVFASFTTVSKDFSYAYADASHERYDISADLPEIGIGYIHEMTERVDFTADIAYLRVSGDLDWYGYDSSGEYRGKYEDDLNLGRVTIGVRGKPSARTEAWLKAGYIDGSDIEDGEFIGTFGVQVNVTPNWGIVGEGQYIDDVTQLSFGVRYSF
jgi:hypothetical protein